MPTYQPLINYLKKNGECDITTALSLLGGYKQVQSRYSTLHRLVKQGTITKFFRNNEQWIRLSVKTAPLAPKLEREIPYGYALEFWASAYAYLVRYGAQHFSSPARVQLMRIMRRWLQTQQDMIQFVGLLTELLENNPSLGEYISIEENLKKAGWITSEWDALDRLDEFIKGFNVLEEENFLDIPPRGWAQLYDPDGLGIASREIDGT